MARIAGLHEGLDSLLVALVGCCFTDLDLVRESFVEERGGGGGGGRREHLNLGVDYN